MSQQYHSSASTSRTPSTSNNTLGAPTPIPQRPSSSRTASASSSRTVSTPITRTSTPTGSRCASPLPVHGKAAASSSSSEAATAAVDYFQPSHERASSLDTGNKRRNSNIIDHPSDDVDDRRSRDFPPNATQQDKLAAMEQHQLRYADNRDSLVTAIDKTSGILTELKAFNQNKWIVHYPLIDTKAALPQGPAVLRRTRTMAPVEQQQVEEEATLNDEATATAAVTTSTSSLRVPPAPQHSSPPPLQRSYTEQPHIPSSSSSSAAAAVPGDDSEADFTANSMLVDADDNDDVPPSHQQKQVRHPADDTAEMSVLKLDLKLGAPGNTPKALVRSLEKSTVAQLLDDRFSTSLRQLDNLKLRISDTQSKVLVTGDLNAGKSTFVNALMRRKMMPVDQQPCTTVFCEVLDASEINEGREEVHMVHPGMLYDVQNANSYSVHTVQDIEKIVAEAEELSPEDAPMLKCYCHDTRATQESLLRNGIVDIALIDAPGLNRDSLKTTALFARQEEIDVVVFVVSAENHFTLSAKEFLWNASNDKAYIFIVVNKFDQIRNKEKCKRLVLEQIRQLSPRTYEDAAELVHFVDSSAVLDGTRSPAHDDYEFSKVDKVAGDDGTKVVPASPSALGFAQLETCLRDFVLQRREKSKLMPAQTYLLRLLTDIEMLSSTNLDVAATELHTARRKLVEARPALEKAKHDHIELDAELEVEEDTVVAEVARTSEADLDYAVDLIGQGKPASAALSLPEWPGIFSAHYYAADVRDVFIRSLEMAVSEVEQAARLATAASVQRIQAMGKARLPEEVEATERVFNPSAMFAKRVKNRKRNIGSVGLGLGLSDDLSSARVSDVLDIAHYFSALSRVALDSDEDEIDDGDDRRRSRKAKGRQVDHTESALITSGLSLGGLGALTLFGGKVYGARSALEAIMHLINVASNPTVKKWGPTVLAVATLGATAYVVNDLPHAIPRNVGRSMKRELLMTGSVRRKTISSSPPSSEGQEVDESADDSVLVPLTTVAPGTASVDHLCFSTAQVKKITREVRKVLRLIEWDLQERFRVGIHARQTAVDSLEEKEQKSLTALAWFDEVRTRSEGLCRDVKGLSMI